MGERQTVKVSVDIGEVIDSLSWDVMRKDIDSSGALGVGDGFGVITIRINNQASVIIRIQEDRSGYVVTNVYDGRDHSPLGKQDAELYGFVPPRMDRQPKKERRFGDVPLGE